MPDSSALLPLKRWPYQGWEIANSQICLTKIGNAWKFAPQNEDAWQWLNEAGVRNASFPTRTQALRCVTALAAQHPLPASSARPRLRRVGARCHQTRCGQWQVTSSPDWNGWLVARTCARDESYSVMTLLQARRLLAELMPTSDNVTS